MSNMRAMSLFWFVSTLNESIQFILKLQKISPRSRRVRLGIFPLNKVPPIRQIKALFLRKPILKRYKSWSFEHGCIFRRFFKMCSAICIDFDHLQIFLALFEIFDHFDIILMFMILFKCLQHLMKYRFPHLILSFLCFLKKVVIFMLKFLLLQTLPIEIYLFFVTQMSSCLFFDFLFNILRHSEAMRIDSVVIFSVIIDLNVIKGTRFIFSICSESMSDILRWASAVFRSLFSLSLVCPQGQACHIDDVKQQKLLSLTVIQQKTGTYSTNKKHKLAKINHRKPIQILLLGIFIFIRLMSSIIQKAAKYKRIATVLVEGEAYLRDPLMPPPQILKPTQSNKAPSPDDITDFPAYKTIPIPQSIGYREGKYRPPSIPLITGWFPYNTYLQQGKVYNWCSCGLSLKNPDCDGSCNAAVTRCRPVQFNVSESGYYKLCNCKNSANAPFCNGTHRDLIKFHHKTHRGFYEIWGYIGFWAGFVYMYWNWYT